MNNKTIHPRRKHLRLRTYDYSASGAYFVTICTHERRCLLGEIIEGKMLLNQLGEIVAEECRRLAGIRPHISVDMFVVMPNHVHIILFIDQTVDTEPMKLGQIVRLFKGRVVRRIRQSGYDLFSWQRGYYDHVIRGEKGLQRIREYVVNNPAKWEEDRNNPNLL
mgnify:CR=1 FL=1|jgi:REP element-mobilizing transposase RayT